MDQREKFEREREMKRLRRERKMGRSDAVTAGLKDKCTFNLGLYIRILRPFFLPSSASLPTEIYSIEI